MQLLPENASSSDIIRTLNDIIGSNKFINSTANDLIGQSEPTAEYLRAGMIAYADGSNWNPGSGAGYYYYSGSAWVKFSISSDSADKVDGFHASQTPTASYIPAADSSNKIALGWLPTSVTGAQDKVPTQSSGTRLDRSWLPSACLSLSYTSGEQAITSGGLLTLGHSLGTVPLLIQLNLICKTGEIGYSAGDTILCTDPGSSASVDRGQAVYWDSTNIYVRYGGATNVYCLPRKDNGLGSLATNGNWKLIVKAWA